MTAVSAAGKKYDQEKAPVVQGCFNYFAEALIAVALVSKYGAETYEVPLSDKNFERVDDATNRYMDAVGRHLLGDAIDGPYDPQSGYLHAAHGAWNALLRLKLMLTRDRIPLRDPNFVPRPKLVDQRTSEQLTTVTPIPTPLNMVTTADERFRERIAAYASDDWSQESGT